MKSLHLKLFSSKAPFIDIRSPKEYQKGSLPRSVNLPILLNHEYESVGVVYKKHGSEAAIEHGYDLVSGDVKTERINTWLSFIKKNPNAILFCFRGGKRSEIAKSWLGEFGVEIPVVEGGYKSLRNTCIELLDSAINQGKKWIIIGGFTGSNKTTLIKNKQMAIDLEMIANHRGSAFGAYRTPQPSQINFEHKLAFSYLNHTFDTLFFEDESRTIGRNYLPPGWYEKMQKSPLIIIRAPMEERIKNIYNEYIEIPMQDKKESATLPISLSNSLNKIKKRIGSKCHDEIQKVMNEAFTLNKKTLHKEWIKKILNNYYDPMYKYQLNRRKQLVLFEGFYDDVKDYINNNF